MLSSAQLEILAAVLDTIVPASVEDGMPGAGAAGVAQHVVAALEQAPEHEPGVVAGLAALGAEFLGLDGPERAAALEALAPSQPGFLPLLLFQTYQGYYESPEVLAALGLPPRAPHPLGYDMEPSDLSLLDPVRAKGKLYRDV